MKKTFKISTILIISFLSIITAVIGESVFTYLKNEQIKKDYSSSNAGISDNNYYNISDSLITIYDQDTYKIFENACLGNSNSNLLSYGCYYAKDNIICKSTSNTELIIDGKTLIINETPSSYINIINNNVYYRDDKNRFLKKYNIDTSETEIVIDKPVGQAVVSTKGVSYIDYQTLCLNFLSFEDGTSKEISPLKISAFSIIGNIYLSLCENKELGFLEQNGDFRKIESDVDRFYYNGQIAIQKNNNIYLIDKSEKAFAEKRNVDGLLLGLHDNKMYFSHDNSIICCDIEEPNISDNTIYKCNTNEIIKSIYVTDNTVEIQCYNNTDSETYKLFSYSINKMNE